MINKAVIMGRVGNDPVIKNEGKIANLTIATTENWRDKEGKKREKTEWHRVVIFNEKMIEAVVSKYVKKGALIYIEGELQTTKYQKDGKDVFTTQIVLKAFGGTLKLIPTGQKQDSQNSIEASQEEEEIPEDEVPF